MKTEAVLFDLYGTLIDIDSDESSDRFWGEIVGHVSSMGDARSPDALRNAYAQAITEAKQASGKNIFARAVDVLLGGHPSGTQTSEFYEVFRRRSRNLLALRTPVIDAARALKAHGVKVAVVSNTETVLTEVDFTDMQFPRELFDQIIFSSDIGFEKPDPRIYEHALKILGVLATASVYVGDSFENDVLGPGALGMTSIWLCEQPANTQLPASCLGVCGRGDEARIISLVP